MKTIHTNIIHARSLLLAGSLLLLAGALGAQAATQIKANNTTAINAAGSWNGGAGPVPGSGDIGLWNNTVTAANPVLVGGAMSLGEIQIVNPGGLVTIWDPTMANALTLNGVNGVGIDMSAATQNLTITTNVLTLGGSQTWNIASGRTLTLTGSQSIANGANNLTIAGGGTLAVQYKNASSDDNQQRVGQLDHQWQHAGNHHPGWRLDLCQPLQFLNRHEYRSIDRGRRNGHFERSQQHRHPQSVIRLVDLKSGDIHLLDCRAWNQLPMPDVFQCAADSQRWQLGGFPALKTVPASLPSVARAGQSSVTAHTTAAWIL